MSAHDDENPYAAPSTRPDTKPLSAKRELREWFGMTRADLMVYNGIGALAVMFVLTNPILDAALALAAVVAMAESCRLGMRRDPMLSGFTNFVKLVSYPSLVVVALVVIGGHYALQLRR
jgi:hypothetical protein